MTNQFMGWWSSVGCHSFRDETYGDIEMLGNNIQGRIVQGQNIQGCIVPVPLEGGTGSKQVYNVTNHTKDKWMLLLFGRKIV